MKSHLQSFSEALNLISRYYPNAPLQFVQTFLLILAKPGITQTEISRRLALPRNTVNRYVTLLRGRPIDGKTMPKLVVGPENEENYTERLLYPSNEGKRLWDIINKELDA